MKFPFLSSRPARRTPSHFAAVEKLESRIAPAVLVNPKTLTYSDVDGDLVTVTISKGTLTAADFVFDTAFGSDGFQQLRLVDFAGDKDKAGAEVSITAEAMGTGNGGVNVGYLNATGIDLGKMTVDGDLARIDAGDAVPTTPGVKRIEVGSMGAFGLTTQGDGATLVSHIAGPLNAFIVTGGLEGASLLASGNIGTIDIGGSVTGNETAQSGSIRVKGSIDTVHIGLDLQGGGGEDSGEIFATRNIGTVVIDGSIIGGDVEGASAKSGRVFAGKIIDLAVVGHEIIGGAGAKSGQIASGAGIGSVQVAGSVRGGAGSESGAIGSGGAISSISILHDLIGYQDNSADGESNGALLSSLTIDHVMIGGDIKGGGNFHSGVIGTERGLKTVIVQGSVIGGDGDESGAIGSNGPIDTVKITGDIEGGDGDQSGRVVSKKSIASVLVQGSVFGGSGTESGAIGALGVVKSVRIEGDLLGSDGIRSGWITSEKRLVFATVVGALGFFESGGVGVRGNGVRPSEAFGSGLISSPVINRVTVGTIGGFQNFFEPGSIQGGAIGTITVTDSLYSGFSFPAFISARTINTITIANNVVGKPLDSNFSGPVEIEVRNSLGSLTIGGDATYLSVVAGGGFDPVEQPANPDAQVGRITVSGDWVESIVAVGTFAGGDGIFGTLDDQIIKGGNAGILSTIARIQIDGEITSGPSASGLSFGFLAQHITALSVNGSAVPLKAGGLNDAKFLDVAASAFVRENNQLLD